MEADIFLGSVPDSSIAVLFCNAKLKSPGEKNRISSLSIFKIDILLPKGTTAYFLFSSSNSCPLQSSSFSSSGSLIQVEELCSTSESNFSILLLSIFIQSDKSPLSGRSGSSNHLTDSATFTTSEAIKCIPFRPTSSLSGKHITFASWNHSEYSLRHFPAPPAKVVATNPNFSAFSQSFSPSSMRMSLPIFIASSI